jgi:hypothetical protein
MTPGLGFTLSPQELYPAAELQGAVAACLRQPRVFTWVAPAGLPPLLSLTRGW